MAATESTKAARCPCRCCRCATCRAEGEPTAERYARLWGYCDIAWFARCSHSKAEAYAASEDFPPPLALEGRLVRWLPEDVQDWFAARRRRPTPASAAAAGGGAATGAGAGTSRGGDGLHPTLTPAGAVPVPLRFSAASGSVTSSERSRL